MDLVKMLSDIHASKDASIWGSSYQGNKGMQERV